MSQPEEKRKNEEAKLYLDPVRNAYVRSQPKWLIIVSIAGIILLFVLFGLQKSGIMK